MLELLEVLELLGVFGVVVEELPPDDTFEIDSETGKVVFCSNMYSQLIHLIQKTEECVMRNST